MVVALLHKLNSVLNSPYFWTKLQLKITILNLKIMTSSLVFSSKMRMCRTVPNNLCLINTTLNHIIQQLSWVKPSFIHVLDAEVVSYTLYIINNPTLTNDIWVALLVIGWLSGLNSLTMCILIHTGKLSKIGRY